jgi:hypothetical protein
VTFSKAAPLPPASSSAVAACCTTPTPRLRAKSCRSWLSASGPSTCTPIASSPKPDALWDRHDLERLYARLEDEYELKERVETLDRKLAVIADTAETLADIIDTRRSLRLEVVVVPLIAIEIATSFYQIFIAHGTHSNDRYWAPKADISKRSGFGPIAERL